MPEEATYIQRIILWLLNLLWAWHFNRYNLLKKYIETQIRVFTFRKTLMLRYNRKLASISSCWYFDADSLISSYLSVISFSRKPSIRENRSTKYVLGSLEYVLFSFYLIFLCYPSSCCVHGRLNTALRSVIKCAFIDWNQIIIRAVAQPEGGIFVIPLGSLPHSSCIVIEHDRTKAPGPSCTNLLRWKCKSN
jgi:hypothetical protein